MHIDSIRLFRVPLSGAKSPSGSAVESVLVEMTAADASGFGEACLAAGPTDAAEWAAGAFACLRDWLAPAVVGRSLASGEDLRQALASFQGNERAKSALDVAWWNLQATQQRKPLHQLLGATRTTIPLSLRLGVMDSTEALLTAIGAALATGYETVALEFRPGWGLEMVRGVRQEFPTAALAIDCDGLCNLAQQEMFFRLEDFFLSSIEQPLVPDDLVGHAMLQSSIRTPICLDQSVSSLERVEQAIDLGSCRLVRIDIGRVGGLTPALAIRDACRAGGIPCGAGGGPHGDVAAQAAAALAASCELPLPLEATRRAADSDGRPEIALSDASGTSAAVDARRFADAAVEQATIL